MKGWKQESRDTWSLRSGELRLVVHRLLGRDGVWFASCYEAHGLTNMELPASHVEGARRQAVKLLVRRMRELNCMARRLPAAQRGEL